MNPFRWLWRYLTGADIIDGYMDWFRAQPEDVQLDQARRWGLRVVAVDEEQDA